MIEPDESGVEKVHSGGPRRITVPAGRWGRGEGRRGLERAGDAMGVEDLSSGTFSRDRVSVLHARVYIAPGNKL